MSDSAYFKFVDRRSSKEAECYFADISLQHMKGGIPMKDNTHETNCRCKLCGDNFTEEEMSDEHYPARCVGNEDIVALDLIKLFDFFLSNDTSSEIQSRVDKGESIEEVASVIFDSKLSTPLSPDGRTAKTLCRNCNTFLGKYDEAYLRFFNSDGDPKAIKGFQYLTKIQIIKAIYAKFLSIPEASNEVFDFIGFLRDPSETVYVGKWRLYFVKRDLSSDLLGLKDIGTGKASFKEGVVYELSDDKFIFNLMNFEKHACFQMTNIFDILKKTYKLIEGVGENGGYHASILAPRLLSDGHNEILLNE